MTPSEHFQTPPLTKESPAEGTSIALPPLPQPSTTDEAKFVELSYWLDVALVVVVLLFAFLAASFPVYNPDFFRQLATGRLLLQGEYHFGVDPFVYTADGAYWANHSWLFALLMYGLYHLGTIGGAAVVIFKAIVIAALAGLLMRAGWRRGQSLWIPAACTALAILAASPRFFLQPVVLSYLFLGVTIWLLLAGRGGKRIGWLLVPLFALWVNCDAWFFLGPLTVGLYLVGELLQQRLSASAGEPQAARQNELWTLGGIFIVGVAACLLSPHHIHALTLPPEFGLTAASDLLENDPQFRTLFYSPVRKEYYSPYFGLSVAGIAYWPLLLLSLASFALSIGRLSWPRLIVWIGFALLSFYNMRTIPFFALVAGPILSLNCLDYIARRFAGAPALTPAWRNGLLGGRIVTLLLGLALLIATVPGWLQNQPQSRRMLAWSVHPDPSLEAMARSIHAWRQTGRLPNDPHWFNAYHEVADYMAWFAPGERVFLDLNLLNSRKAAEDYLAIRKGFQQMVRGAADAESDLTALKTDWRKVLRDWKVHYWIFDYLGVQRADSIPDVILFSHAMQQEWVLCDLSGHMAIFAWRDPQQPGPDPSQGLALDLKRSAFGKAKEAELAPPHGEEPTPPRRWWETYWETWWQPTPRNSSDRDLVGLYDIYYQLAEQPHLVEVSARAWRGGATAGAIASSLPCGPVPNSLLALSWCCTYHDLYPAGTLQPVRQPTQAEQPALVAQNLYINAQFMETPSLYLSVRAARRALSVNPDDGITYFRLGQAYQRLRELPQERSFQGLGSRLSDIRRIQMVAAFQNCLRFPIDDEKASIAHQTLAQVFMQRRYEDVAVHHMREALNKRMTAGVPPGAAPEEFNKNLENASAEVSRRESAVQRLRDRYELTVAAKTGLDRVNVALQMNLAETALDALEQAASDSISTARDMDTIRKVTAVLLDLGQLDRARELLPDPPEGQPVKPEEMDLYLDLAAARGDYEKADRLLEDTLHHAWKPPLGQPMLPPPVDQLGQLVGKALLGEAQRLTGIPSMPIVVENASDFWIRRWRYMAIITALDLTQQRADLHMLRGWLALEAGHSDEARKSFRAALDQIVPEKTWIPEINKLNAWLMPEREIPQIQQLNMRHAIVHDLSKRYLSWLEKEER